MPHEIKQWLEIQENYGGSIILGNGASMATDGRFSYSSLKEYAVEHEFFSQNVTSLFDFFGTDDFELILRIVWQATNVNAALNVEDNATEQAYIDTRSSLINTVRAVHPCHADVADQFLAIYSFLKSFETIVSLNYDLIVYWVMMFGQGIEDGHVFKDCIISSRFRNEWQELRNPIGREQRCSLVFYPHGNLMLARDKVEDERKITANDQRLLDGVLQHWENRHYVPLFVSEGTSEQKVKSIRGSNYLNTVYREVLTSLSENVVLYGWGLGAQDIHILKKMAKSNIRRVAVSVFQEDQVFCNRAYETLTSELGNNVEIEFFNCASEGCWNNLLASE